MEIRAELDSGHKDDRKETLDINFYLNFYFMFYDKSYILRKSGK